MHSHRYTMLIYFLFAIGFVLLVYGANWLVEGAASIASRFRISHVVIGMTIVALGTSAPELTVNLIASFQDASDVAIGNILGSNISNIFLILGVSAIILPLSVTNNSFTKDIPFALLAAIIIMVMANDYLIDGVPSMLYRSDGIILILFFVLFLYYAFGIMKKSENDKTSIKEYSLQRSIIMTFAGIVAMIIGGHWIVNGAIHIASAIGVSEAVISLTMVALGTSLPELATCVAAALKKNSEIIIGNVLGSNIFNVFFVVGTSVAIRPMPFNQALNFDLILGLMAVLLLWFLLLFSRSKTFKPWMGGFFIVLYVAYIAFLFYKG